MPQSLRWYLSYSEECVLAEARLQPHNSDFMLSLLFCE
jgi:hypothetical protein